MVGSTGKLTGYAGGLDRKQYLLELENAIPVVPQALWWPPDMKSPFEKVVAQHGPTVLRVVRAVLGHADADDAWSETFLAAMKAYPDLPADANVEAWLVTIAHRKAIDIHPRRVTTGDSGRGHTGNGIAGHAMSRTPG